MAGDANPNVVMVTVDSFRADHCGFINADSELTPTIDRLANEGMSATQAVVPGPRTPSSIPVLFTGEFMSDDDEWTSSDWQRRRRRIERHMGRFTHMSERFKRNGYETAAFTANPWTTRERNFGLGFDEFYEISANSDDISSKHLSNSLFFRVADRGMDALPGDAFRWSSKKEWFAQWTGFFDLIREQISRLSEPFFLWVFLLDTHQPYVTPHQFREECSAAEMYYAIARYWRAKTRGESLPEHVRELIRTTYRDAVRSVDAFMRALDREIRSYDPVTVFLSDHGEAHGEHGNFGHEQTLYEENLRVPFFVHNAGSSETVDEQLPLQSLSRIVDEIRESRHITPELYTRRFAVSKIENNRLLSVRTPRWKFVTGIDTGESRLYDHRSDPAESENVIAEYPNVSSALSGLVDKHRATQDEKGRTERAVSDFLADERESLVR